jgi:hypothetical protein
MNFSRWFAPAFAGLVLYGLVELLNAAPPIANAGPDKVDVAIDTPVGLDGTASSDPAGRTLTFAWKFLTRPPGSAATLLNSQSATPTFTPDRNGTYQVLLTAKAGGETATDTVVVITKNHPPVANAGVDSGAPIGKRVRLLGLGTDPDMDKLTYAWTLIAKPDSSRASFASPTKASTVLTLDRPGSYVAELKVTDPFGVSAVDTVEVSHVNSAPIANAGPGQSVPLGSLVTLDASRSSDIDEDPLTYRWALTKPKGSASSISDPDALQPTLTVDLAGTYTAALVADDGNGASNAAKVVITTLPINAQPVANAGPDQRIAVGQAIHLDGSLSYDPDGQSLGYAWTLTKKPKTSAAALSSAAAVRPTFVADVDGTYAAKLVVTDSAGRASASDIAVLTNRNVAPIANAGEDRAAIVGAPVQLRGSGSSDVDGGELAFGWALLHAPAGTMAALSDASAVNPSFTPDVPGTYQFQVIVNDGIVNSLADTVIVTTANARPRAAAGPDQTVSVGSPVALDGGASSDANGDALVFSWTLVARPAGSAAELSNPTSPTSGFLVDVPGNYVAQLRVSDGLVWSPHDTVVITTGNSVPVAEAGPDQNRTLGLVALNGGGSSDADGDPLTFRWSFTGRPEASAAVLSSATALAPTFIADINGTYVSQLIVRDDFVDSTPVTVVIEVNGAPSLPTVTVQTTDSAASETGADPGTFTFSRTGSLSAAAEVFFSIGGTATNGVDYAPALTGSITIPAGQTSANLTITPVDDGLDEPNETVVVTLTAGAAYTIGTPSLAVVTIANAATPGAFQLFVPSNTILPEGKVGAAILLEVPAPPGGIVVTLQSSDGTVIQVPPEITVPAAETYAWFEVSALAKLGSATVSAEIAAQGTATALFTVSDESTGVLIEKALAAGEITEEQAYVYRVFAAYGWPGLPLKFRGARSSKGIDPQSRLLRDVRVRFATLSATAQEQVAPLLAPPIYVGSWGDPDVIAAAEASSGSGTLDIPIVKSKLPSTQGEILCAEGSTPQQLPMWANYEVGEFRIWYLSDPLPYKTHIGTPEQSKRLADLAKTEIGSILSKLHAVFGRDLLSDASVGGCNGGDGKYDIYMYGLKQWEALGTEFPYHDASPPTPSWIALSAATMWSDDLIRGTLAHEMMHAIDDLFAKAEEEETYWRVEALGAWAENFVYISGNTEWDYANELFSHPTIYNGAVVKDVLVPLPAQTTDPGDKSEDDRESSRADSAYRKYVFFFYLQHRVGPSVLRTILEKEASLSSMSAIDQALSRGFAFAWADFVVTAWNDTKNGVKKEFSEWDPGLKHGMFEQFEADSSSTYEFGLTEPEKLVPFVGAAVTKPKGIYVPPAAGHWVRAKFTDASTSFVVLRPSRPKPDSILRMQALFKANGKWSGPVDFFSSAWKFWCRDRPADKYPADKLEEIVLIASNGQVPPAAADGSADWNWFEDTPGGKDLLPNLVVSNAGCWRWTGSSQVTETFSGTGTNIVQVSAASGITFELDDARLADASVTGLAFFALVASGEPPSFATGTFQISGNRGDCTVKGGPTTKPIEPSGDSLRIFLTKWTAFDTTNPAPRTVTGLSSELMPDMTETCPFFEPVTKPMPHLSWLYLTVSPPQDSAAKLSEDGGQITGTFTQGETPGVMTKTTVSLTAIRNP